MKKIIYVLGMLLIPLSGFSATDGNLGLTSTGSININMTITSVVQISQLKDFTLTYTPGVNTGDLTETLDLCIYANNSAGQYNIKATSSNANAGVMRVATSTENSYIPYELVWFTDKNATGARTTLTSDIESKNLINANTTSQNCNSGSTNSAAIQLTFKETDLNTASAGEYTDTITVLVSPI